MRLKSDTKAGGSAPPLLKKLSIAWPTLSSLTVKIGGGCADDCGGKGGSPGTGGIVVGGVGVRNQPRRKVEQYVIAGIAQSRLEARWQAGGGQGVERAGASARLSKSYSCATI